MSVFGLIWDAAQDSHISELQDEIDALKKRVDVLEAWIWHLQGDEIERQSNKTEAQRASTSEGEKSRTQDETGQGLRR